MPKSTQYFLIFLLTFCTNFLPAAAPVHVYVDDGYTAEACGGHAWHVDAFASIQAGIDAVAPGGTVQIAPGRYAEFLSVPKPLTLRGPLTCVDPNAPSSANPLTPNSSRGGDDEAVIYPPATVLDLPRGILITINSDRVTVEGLTLDGNNPHLADGVLLNHVDANAAVGIGHADRHVNGTLIAHNILRNFYRAGILFQNDTHRHEPITPTNAILYNWIDNLPFNNRDADPTATPVLTGVGIRTVYEAFTISQNTVTRVSWGIDIRNIMRGLGPATPAVTRNRIQAYNLGVNLILFDRNDAPQGDGPDVLAEGNWITITPRSTTPEVFRYGISVRYIEDAACVLVKDNLVFGGEAGVCLWELPVKNGGQVTISGGTITGSQYGIWFRNHIPIPQTGAARDSTVVVRNLSIQSPTAAGVCLDDDHQGFGAVILQADNVTVTGGPVGLWLKGGRASLQGTVHLRGQTDRQVKLDANDSLDAPLPDIAGLTVR